MARTCAELQGACGADPYGGVTHAATRTDLCTRVEGDPEPQHHRVSHRAQNEMRSPRGKTSLLAGRERALRRSAAGEVRLESLQLPLPAATPTLSRHGELFIRPGLCDVTAHKRSCSNVFTPVCLSTEKEVSLTETSLEKDPHRQRPPPPCSDSPPV